MYRAAIEVLICFEKIVSEVQTCKMSLYETVFTVFIVFSLQHLEIKEERFFFVNIL